MLSVLLLHSRTGGTVHTVYTLYSGPIVLCRVQSSTYKNRENHYSNAFSYLLCVKFIRNFASLSNMNKDMTDILKK